MKMEGVRSYKRNNENFKNNTIKFTLLCVSLLCIPSLIVYHSSLCRHLQLFPKTFCYSSPPLSLRGDYSQDKFSSSREYAVFSNSTDENLSGLEKYNLERVLKKAATKDKTVIITVINNAWAKSNSTFDIFLESFRVGIRTGRLVSHLVVITLDSKAYARCLQLHTHCYPLHSVHGKDDNSDEAYFMSPAYLKIVWRNIHLLQIVLEMGYNFVFTDIDILWFRDPFPQLYKDVDLQVSCDSFPDKINPLNNIPNLGFKYARSNSRSIQFYRFLHTSREKYPGSRITEVFNRIKHDLFMENLGLRIRFLDTTYFGGLCEPSKDFNLVCTMHANCCTGLDNKVHDLKVMMDDWKKFRLLMTYNVNSSIISWSVPQECGQESYM